MKNKKQENLTIPVPPIFRTGIFKTLDMDEPNHQQSKQQPPTYQQPNNQNKPVFIEQPGLFYNGHHFTQFLRQYEMTADSLNASKYDRALQIGRFMKTEELKDQIELMDGYEECDWDTLRASMIESWSYEYTILYTTTDLVNLSEEFSRDNKTVSYKAFKTYFQRFSEILDFLLIQRQLRSRQDAVIPFISAFPQELQRNIKRHLNHNSQLPQAPNGSRLPPLWEHLTEAAGMEIKLEELAKEIESLKQQIQDIQSPVICNTPHSLSQLEPVTDYTELATDYTDLATDYTDLATDYTELAMEFTEPVMDAAMPAMITAETEREPLVEESVTTTKLADLEEWKAASLNVMDTPMALVHTVIYIPGISLDELDTKEEISNQSNQLEKLLDQSPQSNNNPLQIQNLLLTDTSMKSHKFPTIPSKIWIHNIYKYLEIEIFNKQLFKPHLDLFGILRINKHVSQHLEIKNIHIEEPKDKIISAHDLLTIGYCETTDLPISNQSVMPLISAAQIPEEVFSIPTPPDPPDITTFINPQKEENLETRQLSKLPINNLAQSELPRELFALVYLLQKILPQLPISIPPDPLQKSYGNIKPPRLLVGVG
ncbi:hypothetical protein PGT21_027371 [Puccinia graminis f. sp. tritici]|uniref:Uncharacterized protein n=1 Tax=Puccinia graminis f. sp. tritici TaxID=56615 RepID=A0A5B0N584_PUCGR|nr:hypothetical protein PGT21_027371 [Puccinia graminis f. sp. tritici]